MTYYYWLIVRLAPGASIPSFLEYWQPQEINIRPTHNGMHSVLFSSLKDPSSFQSWASTAGWHAMGWMNECMNYPANLGYSHTRDSFNRYVAGYGHTDQRL